MELSERDQHLPGILALVDAERRRGGSLLHLQDPEFYGRFYGDAGATFVARERGVVVGFHLLAFGPALNQIWAPYLADLAARPDECGVFIHALVAPEHRRRGIQGTLHGAALIAARRRGLRHLLATVHPDNGPCLRMLAPFGFRVLDVKPVYEARLPRALLHFPVPDADVTPAPRLALCHLPTPLQPLPRLGAELGVDLWVKRDDLTDVALGGNKARMLERFVGDALQRGARTLVTRGSWLSNHCRQTAAVAARLGLGCELVLRGHPVDNTGGNLFLDRLLGAQIHWTGDRDPEAVLGEVLARAEADGLAPYRIAYGGADPVGARAYVDAFAELCEQDPRPFDRIFVACSSGATQAGLVAGAMLHERATRIHGISCDDPAARITQRITEIAGELGRCHGHARLHGVRPRVAVDDRFIGAGYGRVGELERRTIERFARREGLLLDPVYTARAAGAMLARIAAGELDPGERVLLWHTGGVPSLFSLCDEVLPAAARS